MKMFPIMVDGGTPGPCPSSIPWDAIAHYEGMAQENHRQSLARLAERGGLDPVEAYFIMTGRTWEGIRIPVSKEIQQEACTYLDKVAKDQLWEKLRTTELQVGAMRGAIEAQRYMLERVHWGAGILKALQPTNGRCGKCGQPYDGEDVCGSCVKAEAINIKPNDLSTKYFCNKCGFHGGTENHGIPGKLKVCPYFAAPVAKD